MMKYVKPDALPAAKLPPSAFTSMARFLIGVTPIAARSAVDNIIAGEAVTAECLKANITFQIGVKIPVLIIERAERAVGDVIVGVKVSAAALLLKIEETKTITDGYSGARGQLRIAW